MIKYSLHWHMKFQEHLTFIFQNLYLWNGYNFCHPSLWRNEVTLGKWKLWTLFDTHIHCFFLCAEIYATSHIIILFKAFPTRLPYQDIENRTYLYVLYIIFFFGLFRMGALISLTSLTQLTQMSEMMKRRLEMMRLKFLRMRVINQRKKLRKVIAMERKAMRWWKMMKTQLLR